MSKIHYFQRYSSIENTVTNNTLQLIAQINNRSVRATSKFLMDLTDNEFNLGLDIVQQAKGGDSVPDGMISQKSFKIVIESKVDASVDFDQIKRHLNCFNNEELKVLLLLTKSPVTSIELEKLKDLAFQDVCILNRTFRDVCNALEGLFQPHDEEILEIIEDYKEYCNDFGLYDQSPYLMRIVPCGQSFEINEKHNVYFQPFERGFTKHKYIGIYHHKRVSSILEIISEFEVKTDETPINKNLIQGNDLDLPDEKLFEIINDMKKNSDFQFDTHLRFFCGKMLKTNYQKTSPGGIPGSRYYNLKTILGEFTSLESVAIELGKISWV